MKFTSTVLSAGLVLAIASTAWAQPAPFYQDFDALSNGDFAGTSNLLRRDPGSVAASDPNDDLAGEISVVGDANNRYLQWGDGDFDPLDADAHVVVADTWQTGTPEYFFDLTFKIATDVVLRSGGTGAPTGQQQGMQFTYVDGQGDRQKIFVGRHGLGGVAIEGDAGAAYIDQIIGLDPADPQALSVAGDYAEFAYVRVQAAKGSFRVKGWGEYVAEPTWDSAYAATLVDPDYAGLFLTDNMVYRDPDVPESPANAESGIRFKWRDGLLLDDIDFKLLPAGDGNGDGLVTDADYTIWADNFGATEDVSYFTGDYNGDGLVTDADYTIWADNFGANPNGIPEPASLALLATGAAGLIRRRR